MQFLEEGKKLIYVYDIILNWSDDKVYEFFEWELNDDLEHIKRIPLFKVNSKILDDVLNYNFQIDNDFLNKIYNLTEIYTSNNVEKIEYASLFSDGVRTIAIEFSSDGKSICRSKLLLDEEQEVEILSNKLVEFDIKIKTYDKIENNLFTTRLESEIKKILTIEINDSYNKGNFDKLKYLYFEYFGREQDDIEMIYKKLLSSIDKEINYSHNKIYEVVKLSYLNKN